MMLCLDRVHKVLLIVLMMAVTAVAFRSQGTPDINIWLGWGQYAYENGVVNGYDMYHKYYPPFTMAFLWGTYWVADLLGIAPVYGLKLSLLFFLLVSALIIYYWSGRNLLATLFFYGALLLSALGLVYLDILLAPFILYGLWSLRQGKTARFVVLFSIAAFIKYPPLLVAPFFIVYLFAVYVHSGKIAVGLKEFFKHAVLPGVLVLGLIVFTFREALLFSLYSTINTGWLSAFALNANWVATRLLIQNGLVEGFPAWYEATVVMINPTPDTPGLIAKYLYLFFFLTTLLAFTLRKKTMENLLLFSMLGSFCYFMFYTGAHENHLFLASILAIALFCLNQQYLYLAIGIIFISTLNMFMFYGVSGTIFLENGTNACLAFHSDMVGKPYSYWFDAPLLIATFNTIYFLVLWISTVGGGWKEMADCLRRK